MAAAVPQLSPMPTNDNGVKVKSVKELAESPTLTSIPTAYTCSTNPKEILDSSSPDDSIPVIDLSLLTSGTPDQRSKAIQDLAKACEEWGFFMVVNHGVPESLMKAVVKKCEEFFDLTAEEKREFEGKNMLDPIRCGTSFNLLAEKVHFWRDFLKVIVHPQFNFPHKPPALSEVAREYCKQVRDVVKVLLRGISVSLGFEQDRIEKVMNLESSLQVFVSNYYPPCPQPELALGMPPHSDHGLLSVLINNQIAGLQIQHQGRWVQVHSLPNSLLINTADHLEIFSNGRYKSVLHRAVVNNTATRVSIAIANGPSPDTLVSPAKELADPPAYMPMKYKDYIELQQLNKLDGKSSLDTVKL